MAETPAHTDALTKGAGTRIQEQTGAMDQPVTVLESRDVIGADVYVSLSRLNHRLPRGQAHPEVMQGTAEFHHEIADTGLPQADPVFDDTTALDAAVDMLDPQPTVVQGLVGQLLLPWQFLATWFLGRHEDRHLGQRERQKAQILQQPTPGR